MIIISTVEPNWERTTNVQELQSTHSHRHTFLYWRAPNFPTVRDEPTLQLSQCQNFKFMPSRNWKLKRFADTSSLIHELIGFRCSLEPNLNAIDFCSVRNVTNHLPVLVTTRQEIEFYKNLLDSTFCYLLACLTSPSYLCTQTQSRSFGDQSIIHSQIKIVIRS